MVTMETNMKCPRILFFHSNNQVKYLSQNTHKTCDTNVSAFMKDLDIPKSQIFKKANFGGFQVAMATMLVNHTIIWYIGQCGKTSI